ncbi:unnamed protein product [Anisakis simplex]|uniref:Importin-5 n=1 Tax=Anisakis simplex TaxID=6269 RepID=A0A0M3KIV1_ANISI|nr:unnamed protein product [Anisakis simplex]
MVSLCESGTNMVKKKASNFIPTLLEQCLGLMTELEDDAEEWLSCDNAEEDSDEENAGIGETSLDRISCALGGKAILQPFLQIIPRLIQDTQNWKNRHAAIMGLSTIGEGCRRQMEPMIEQIVDTVLGFLQDEDCPKAIIALYLPQIMEKLEFVLEHTFKQLLERGKKLVLEQVITTIASVADAAQDQFVSFYDRYVFALFCFRGLL